MSDSESRARTTPEATGGGEPQSPALEPSRRLVGGLLLVVLMVSAGAVVAAFNPAPHTGGDNAAYLTLAYSLLEDGSYTELYDPARPPHTKYPPVFPVILTVLMMLGFRTWTAFKTVAALSTVAAAGLTFLWARQRVGVFWAFGVGLVFALCASVVYYSHWILSDPTFVVFTLLSLWALGRADEDEDSVSWLVLGVAAAGVAYFTRSAGLPLVLAVLGWLALRRRWRGLAAAVVGLGIPALMWAARARGVGEYVSEFWFVDPYQPGLGRVDLLGLAERVAFNLAAYVANHLPSGIIGVRGWHVAVLGVVVTVLGLVGWVAALRKRVGPAELFLPLYAGLILVWPEVWSGDRFALPLYPLLFAYGAWTIREGGRRIGGRAPAVLGIAALSLLIVPSAWSWVLNVREARYCGAMAKTGGPYACYPDGVVGYVAAAVWSADGLPEGSVVLARKPRIFFALSGVASRVFPFDLSPDALLATADSVGARYVLLDQWDNVSMHYLGGAVGGRPGAFCAVQGWDQGSGGAQLLGILPEAERVTALDVENNASVIWCETSYTGEDARQPYLPSSNRVPLLDGLGP